MDFPQAHHELVLSLCSGGGGLDQGIRLALSTARVIGYVEIELPAIACLVSHMEEGTLDAAPLWTNLRTFDWGRWRGCVDGIFGGYPCQPFSISGSKRAHRDPRHLWPTIKQGIEILQPRWCFFENVSHHLRLGFDVVARDLHSLGYTVAATLLTASEVGAPHKRERLFILAILDDPKRHTPLGDSDSPRWRTESDSYQKLSRPRLATRKPTVGYPHITRLERRGRSLIQRPHQLHSWPPSPQSREWKPILERFPELAPSIEPTIRRVDDGMDTWMDRLRLLGNGVVPLQAALAFQILSEDLGVTW